MISEDPAAGRAGSAPGGSSLAAVVSARLLRAGFTASSPELIQIRQGNLGLLARWAPVIDAHEARGARRRQYLSTTGEQE